MDQGGSRRRSGGGPRSEFLMQLALTTRFGQFSRPTWDILENLYRSVPLCLLYPKSIVFATLPLLFRKLCTDIGFLRNTGKLKWQRFTRRSVVTKQFDKVQNLFDKESYCVLCPRKSAINLTATQGQPPATLADKLEESTIRDDIEILFGKAGDKKQRAEDQNLSWRSNMKCGSYGKDLA